MELHFAIKIYIVRHMVHHNYDGPNRNGSFSDSSQNADYFIVERIANADGYLCFTNTTFKALLCQFPVSTFLVASGFQTRYWNRVLK